MDNSSHKEVAVRCTDCTWEGDIVMANCERHKIIPKPHKEVASGENWESEFDADAKDSTDGQFATLIVSRAMYHQLTQPAGADASHITKKLMARIATTRAETIAEVLGKMDKIVYRWMGDGQSFTKGIIGDIAELSSALREDLPDSKRP